MAYASHGFYLFHLGVFHVKIVVSLWLIYCCLVNFVVLASLNVKPILTHKEGNDILESLYLVVFTNKVVLEPGLSLKVWVEAE